jgi:aminoglycoside phosphotransferase (APT) family kinase protein
MTRALPNNDVPEASIRSELGELSTSGLKQIGGGFRSIAFESTSHIILVGKHPGASESFRREHRILPDIAEALPVDIPIPDFLIESSSAFPHGLMCYPRIIGTVLTKENIPKANLTNLALETAGFLTSLHSIDISTFELDQPDIRLETKLLRDETLPILKQSLNDREYDLVFRWWTSYIDSEDNFTFDPVFIHGDLWYENLILTEDLQHLAGVIDFEACGLKDPAADFAPLTYLGTSFCESVLSEYLRLCNGRKIDNAAFSRRIKCYAETREFGGLRYAIEHDNGKELEDSLHKLRNGTILNGAG